MPNSPFLPIVFMVALCNGFHNTTLNLRSRSPLAHFELIYIYNRPTAVTYTQRRSRSIRSNFIPNDCTFGLFRRAAVAHHAWSWNKGRGDFVHLRNRVLCNNPLWYPYHMISSYDLRVTPQARRLDLKSTIWSSDDDDAVLPAVAVGSKKTRRTWKQ